MHDISWLACNSSVTILQSAAQHHCCNTSAMALIRNFIYLSFKAWVYKAQFHVQCHRTVDGVRLHH